MNQNQSDPLEDAWIDPAVHVAHPDYSAALIVATGLEPGPSSAASEALLQKAEAHALGLLEGCEPHELAEIAAWRQAYLSFGVKPRDARSSIEALMRRSDKGLPRIDRLTDTYNAVSILHLTPIGGEDLHGYQGPAQLVIATGDETFDTMADGEPVIHQATPGEVIWRDDAGVTCRRWNWRQCIRTRLTENTTDALFIVDGLGPDSSDRAQATASTLIEALAIDSPTAAFRMRLLVGV